jgi:hypothetical protein
LSVATTPASEGGRYKYVEKAKSQQGCRRYQGGFLLGFNSSHTNLLGSDRGALNEAEGSEGGDGQAAQGYSEHDTGEDVA